MYCTFSYNEHCSVILENTACYPLVGLRNGYNNMITRETAQIRITSHTQSGKLKPLHTLYVWLSTWEIYPMLLIASFLRFYQLNTTEFDGD
jgi:hypothetical protein